LTDIAVQIEALISAPTCEFLKPAREVRRISWSGGKRLICPVNGSPNERPPIGIRAGGESGEIQLYGAVHQKRFMT